LLDVVAVGNINVDLAVELSRIPGPDEKLVAKRHYITLGGAAANFAIACVRLGLTCGLIARVGQDPMGEIALRALSHEGIDIRHVKICPGLSTGVALVLWISGSRGVVSCRGANDALSPADLDRVYLSSAKLILGASLRLPLAKALAEACSGLGITLVLDPGGTLASYNLSELSNVLRDVDIFTPNEVELARITGLKDIKAAAEAAWSHGPKLVVVKAGPRGCFIFDGQEFLRIRALKPAEFVDPTGAGDAFNAGLALGLLKGLEPVQSAELGVAMATLKIGRKGASNMPTLKELKAFLARVGWRWLLDKI